MAFFTLKNVDGDTSMTVFVIWGVSALTYLGFRLWYDGLGKPLTADPAGGGRMGQGPV